MKDFTNDFTYDQMGEANLDFMPILKIQLKSYVINTYQEDADISNESLMREWWYLYEENLLHLLSINELVFSTK